MNIIISRGAISGVLYLLIFLSGYRLSHSGKPYSIIILTIHKLISLAVALILLMVVLQFIQSASLSIIELAISVITAIALLLTIITGGLLSTDRPTPPIIRKLHQITPFVCAIFSGVTLYYLIN